MTKNRQSLHRVNSPCKSPRRHNSSLRKKALVRRISGEVQFGAASKANLKVVVRLRPQNQREDDKGARCVVDILDEHMLVFDPKEEGGDGWFFKGMKQRYRDLNKRQPLEKKFVFENVFGVDSTNAELFEATAHPLVDTLLQGYNCSVFAYGATGSGKTYTMLGRSECPGITSLTLQELYQRLDDLKSHRRCEVAVSYLEVYNETVRDLLGTGKPLALQEIGQQVMVPGLSLHKPNSAQELLQMLAQGNSNRTQHATDANAESSRSHAVFQIFVRQQDLEASAKATVTISKLSMIDLAGSERGAATGYRGVRFKEGSSINKSLLALGNCINALAGGQRHIPYRDSKLTRLLKDSLGGNCRSVMIAAISPASICFEDTYNTLRYAERAKTIRTTIRNNVKNVDQHVSDYIMVVAGLREEVATLRAKVNEYQKKEEEWEAKYSEMASSAPAPASPQPSTPAHKMEVEEQKEEEVSEEEAEAQRQLQDVSAEQKALRQELLQLEAAYKATELKRHHWTARLARVQVIAFASSKLDKTIKKCERTIHALDARLSSTAHFIETVKEKVVANQAKMQEAQEALSCFGSEADQLSKHSQGLVERHQASVTMRDTHQLGEHLQSLVQDNFKEQHTSEQLVHVLLGAVRDLYLELYQKDQCCPKVRGIFQHVVDGLDECKIVWADQQSVAEEEEDGQAVSGEPVSQPDAGHFTTLPSFTTVVISPTITIEPTTTFRKSSLMSSVSASSVQPHNPVSGDAITTTAQPRPVSPPHTPVQCHTLQNTAQENSPNTTTTLTSPVLSLAAQALVLKDGEERAGVFPATTPCITTTNTPAKSLNATCDRIPSVPQLSSVTTPALTLTTTNTPSASQLSFLTLPASPAQPFNTTIDMPNTGPPSASKLSILTLPLPAARVLNTTINIHSPHTTTHHLAVYSDTKVLPRDSSVPQLSPNATHLPPSSQVVSLPSSTSTLVSGPAVARQLFLGDKMGLNSTFNISQGDPVEESRACPPPADCAREAPHRSPGGVGMKAISARSPLVPVTNRTSHSNLMSIPEKQTLKPTFARGFRGLTNRRGMSRTPHKGVVQPFTPGKGGVKEGGMRRSISTPSLLSQHSSTRPLTASTKRKLKGFGGTLSRTTSFLKGNKTTATNQENVPPFSTRRPSAGMHRPPSPSNHSRSPAPAHSSRHEA